MEPPEKKFRSGVLCSRLAGYPSKRVEGANRLGSGQLMIGGNESGVKGNEVRLGQTARVRETLGTLCEDSTGYHW